MIIFLYFICVIPSIQLAKLKQDRDFMEFRMQEKMSSMKQKVSRLMAHEIKTPLMIASANLHFLEDDLSTDNIHIQEKLAHAISSCNNAMKVVDNLISLEPLGMGRAIFTKEYVPALLSIDNMLQTSKILCRNKSIELKYHDHTMENKSNKNDDTTSIHCLWDYSKIEKVIGNLLNSAIHTTMRTGCVSVTTTVHSFRLTMP
jgi:signal transduction histidine kinase